MSLILAAFLACTISYVAAFSNESPSPGFTLSDRFKASCPCDLSSISQYDPSLASVEMKNTVDKSQRVAWVAVFRSNNNMPSVLVKDDFLNAMRIATNVQGNDLDINSGDGDITFQSSTVAASPVPGQIETSSETDSKNGDSSGVKARTPGKIREILSPIRLEMPQKSQHDSCFLITFGQLPLLNYLNLLIFQISG